jgi:hypothetical protein
MAMRHYLRALGRDDLPAQIALGGRTYLLRQTFKHNSVSAVGLYEADGDRVVLKCYRRAPAVVVPMRWAGRLMATHEAAVLRRVQDVPGVPRLRGRYGSTGIVRDYVEGAPLTRDSQVDEEFCSRLMAILEELHRRGIAYVDLEKAENILIGEDGRPHLIDFQVAFNVPDRYLGGTFPMRWVRRHLQGADLYHARKHMRHLMRARLSRKKIQDLRGRPWIVMASNALTAPYRRLRRLLLRKR